MSWIKFGYLYLKISKPSKLFVLTRIDILFIYDQWCWRFLIWRESKSVRKYFLYCMVPKFADKNFHVKKALLIPK